jgi:quercetin dioxygenase-like cupin family protein
MPVKPGDYLNLIDTLREGKWTRPEGEPEGMEEIVLNRHEDGSYTHLLRVQAGLELKEPVVHDFYEEAYYLEGEILNTKTGKTIRAGDYVFHMPGEEHGPFKCLKTSLILEFRYFR